MRSYHQLEIAGSIRLIRKFDEKHLNITKEESFQKLITATDYTSNVQIQINTHNNNLRHNR